MLGGAEPAGAEETVGTLTLDALSFISFGRQQTFMIPSGSTIKFHFGEPRADGSVPFTISPGDVSIASISLAGNDGELRYSLASPTSGLMRTAEGGRRIDFRASVNATLVQAGGEGTYTYSMPFTTETLEATSLSGDLEIEVTGMRLVDGVWYVQLVGATVNKANAFPAPGTAVYTVLSGSFDRIP
jgi:hypothetical protein